MKHTSLYSKKNFKRKINPRYISSLITLGPILTLCLSPIFIERSDEERSRGIVRIINTLKQLNSGEILDLILIGIPISLILTGLMYKMHNFKKIIVQVELKEKDNEIEFISRKINTSKLERKSLKYNDIQIKEVGKVYDAMSMGSYSGFEIESNLKHVGYLLNNHFVWKNSEINDIIENIKKTKANTVYN